MTALDPRYVAARRVLLDALVALDAHRDALVIAGAQAVYLHTGDSDLAVAPFTTDADLSLDPARLDPDPRLDEAMRGAGFVPQLRSDGHEEPGTWTQEIDVDGHTLLIPVDLIVPESLAGSGRRGARLGPHGQRAARRASGLEATLVDHVPMTIAALDPADRRTITAAVAGPGALLVAKAHKIADRLATSGRPGRLVDKDAADVVRLMQTTSPREVGATLARLAVDPLAGTVSGAALERLAALFGRRGAPGIEMAVRALQLALPAGQVETLATAYTRALLTAVGTERDGRPLGR